MFNFISRQKNKGMTLVELLVVLAIMGIISGMVVINYSGYRSSASIKVTSDDIALSIRQAQTFALGVRSISSGVFPGYGVHFDTYDANGTQGGNGEVVTPPVDSTLECGDKIDNDGDGSADKKDRSCHTDFNSSNPGSYKSSYRENRQAQCSDGLDNASNDGVIDSANHACHTDRTPENTWSYNPMWDDESGSTSPGLPECIDLLDNNGNDRIDYDEPNCHSDGNSNNPDSYNPNINSEKDMNNIVFNYIPKKNLLSRIVIPVFADSSVSNISGDSNTFILFADIPCFVSDKKGNNQYDYPSAIPPTPCGGSNTTGDYVCNVASVSSGFECMDIFSTPGTDKIVGICVNDECENSDVGNPGSLDIVFNRPNPDAIFCFRRQYSVNSGCTSSSDGSPSVSRAGIIVKSNIDGKIKKVIVYSTGQISVQ